MRLGFGNLVPVSYTHLDVYKRQGDTRMRIRGGEVQLSGSCLAAGYVGGLGDAAGARALTDDRFIDDQGVRWYRTGDSGELLGGMLTVTGRLDRVIISGGVNVSLDEVERVVREPVSYTHLDVYKRQRSTCSRPSAQPSDPSPLQRRRSAPA